MSIFEDIHLQWGGEEYIIPSNRVMGAIARVEEIITLSELTMWAANRKMIRVSTLAQAYAAVLKYAGATVEVDEVYAGMFGEKAGVEGVVAAMQGMMMMMIPPDALASKGEPAPKKSAPSAGTSSSGKRTRRR